MFFFRVGWAFLIFPIALNLSAADTRAPTRTPTPAPGTGRTSTALPRASGGTDSAKGIRKGDSQNDFAPFTNEQVQGLDQILKNASYSDLEWVIKTAKRRLKKPKSAFDPAALTKEVEAGFGKADSLHKMKMNMVLLMIMMGDVAGALREMALESEKQNQQFNELLVKKLQEVQEAKRKVLATFASKPPPTAHDNTNDPQGAARDQNKAAKYTQWVVVATQTMSELQESERELMDVLSEGRRNVNDLWEAYEGMKESEGRTTRKILKKDDDDD
jgi:hypothetical protein